MKVICMAAAGLLLACNGSADEEQLELDVVSYEAFAQGDPDAIETLQRALNEKGIAGIRGVPGYHEKVVKFIEAARAFSSLPESVKESYAPSRLKDTLFVGYEKGKEKFKRPDGQWVIDDLKNSYYAFLPTCPNNKWPLEVDLKTPFEEMGSLMSEIGKAVMEKIGLLGSATGIELGDTLQLGRMLYYQKNARTEFDNPFWCGAHFDHSLFTVLLPAFYFENGEAVAEPDEAGLFVKPKNGQGFSKVAASDPTVIMFQVGEFGQLASNDAIRATEHRVHKSFRSLDRYTMALFFDAPMDAEIRSFSELTKDARYGGGPGDSCTYSRWNEESFKRYIVE